MSLVSLILQVLLAVLKLFGRQPSSTEADDESSRVTAAADAGLGADRVPDATDPFDRDRA